MFPNKQKRLRQKISFVILSVMVVLLSGCTSQTVQPEKVYHVGILSDSEDLDDVAKGFKAGMADLGYIEGKNIIYDMHSTDSEGENIRETAEKFVADKVDLILAYPTGNSMIAKAAAQGTGIPVVFAVTTIEGNDLIENVRQPGGNITGVRQPAPEVTIKRMELLLEMAPRTKRVWLTYKLNYSASYAALELLRPKASSMGVTLVEVPVNNVADIKADLAARSGSGGTDVDAILMMPEPVGNSPAGWEVINDYASRYDLPIIGQNPPEVYSGAVLTYLPDNYRIGQLASTQADKIFKGAPAGTVLVITPESDLRINYRRARELNLTISEGLLSTAVEIIR